MRRVRSLEAVVRAPPRLPGPWKEKRATAWDFAEQWAAGGRTGDADLGEGSRQAGSTDVQICVEGTL